VGKALLRRLLAAEVPVRCLVRDPRRLGDDRVRVHIARGDLADPASFRHALRGVDTVVHLASAIRDQPGASIEELNAVATMRLVRTAEQVGVERFVFFSVVGATRHSRTRFMRAKAVAERAVVESAVPQTVFAAAWIYAAGDPFLELLERMSRLPVVPISGRGQARFEPIWAEDVAACVMAALEAQQTGRFELAGPEILSYAEIMRLALQALGRPRPVVPVPIPLVRAGLSVLRGPLAFATWDEVELLETSLLTARGTADAERLGVRPRRMAEVLG
jgi:NADH dehydrogenase